MQYSQKTTQEEIDKRGNCQWKRSKIEVFKNSAVAVTFYIDCADIDLRKQFKQDYAGFAKQAKPTYPLANPI